MFVTDRLLLSEITAQHWPPAATPNSYSHHKISFFPSLSLSPQTHSLSLSVRSLAFSLCLSYTQALSFPFYRPLVPAAVTLWPFRFVILSSSVRELAGGPTEMSGNIFCPERRRPNHNPHFMTPAKARTQSSDGWRALAAKAVQSGHSWCPKHGQNQQDHHRGLITAKTHLVCQQYSRDRPKLDPTNPDAAK